MSAPTKRKADAGASADRDSALPGNPEITATDPAPQAKRGRGRPPGSKNKPKTIIATAAADATPPVQDLKPHPLADEIPEMLTDEYAGLVVDIKAHGLREPITLFEGMILDGRHRYRACMELGIEPKIVTFEGTRAEAWALVLSLNAHRRHLTIEQKQKIILAELTRDPTQSDRAIGKKAKVDHKTVAKARTKANGEIPHKAERKEATGRKARGAKPKTPITTRGKVGTAGKESTTPQQSAAKQPDTNPLLCSFCSKSSYEVKKLIAGPSVFICDECIELCNDILREHGERANPRPDDRILADLCQLQPEMVPDCATFADKLNGEAERFKAHVTAVAPAVDTTGNLFDTGGTA